MKRTVNTIILHCSASPNNKPFTIKDVDAWHKERNFKRNSQAARGYNPSLKYVGYHYVIERDGTISSGRSLEEVGAHVQGNNSNSIGVCLIGTDEYTPEQWESLQTVLIYITAKISGKLVPDMQAAQVILKNLGITIKGHRDCSPDLNGDGQITRNEWLKTCPGFEVKQWLKEVKCES